MTAAIALLGFLRLSYERDVVRLRGRITHRLYEISGGVAKFRLAAAEERVYGRWAVDQAAEAIGVNRAKSVALFSEMLEQAILPVTQAGVFAAIVYLGLTDQTLGLGMLVAFLTALGQTAAGVTSLAKSGQDLMALEPMLQHARPILEATPESPAERLDPGELSGGIEVSHVDFRYAPNSPFVLQDLSLQIAPGEFVAIVGASGCGKSTLLRMLLALDAPEAGAILIDGMNLRDLDIPAVRRQIGVVLQDSQLFAGSLLDNILGANVNLSDEAAWRAAESAGLADDIRDLPMGMQTICGDGIGLSGGQIQRVMIARALINRPRILLFDEATSALDNRTQAIVTESLTRLRATRIVVAHRLSTVMSADRIIVMRDGRVVESGRFDELIGRGGLFSDLAARQQG
jgi:ABC-type bacteriocin/lantibiotic exporter with double-glycine peptidase domain